MKSLDNAAKPDAWFKMDRDVLELGGRWTIRESARLDPELRSIAEKFAAKFTPKI